MQKADIKIPKNQFKKLFEEYFFSESSFKISAQIPSGLNLKNKLFYSSNKNYLQNSSKLTHRLQENLLAEFKFKESILLFRVFHDNLQSPELSFIAELALKNKRKLNYKYFSILKNFLIENDHVHINIKALLRLKRSIMTKLILTSYKEQNKFNCLFKYGNKTFSSQLQYQFLKGNYLFAIKSLVNLYPSCKINSMQISLMTANYHQLTYFGQLQKIKNSNEIKFAVGFLKKYNNWGIACRVGSPMGIGFTFSHLNNLKLRASAQSFFGYNPSFSLSLQMNL